MLNCSKGLTENADQPQSGTSCPSSLRVALLFFLLYFDQQSYRSVRGLVPLIDSMKLLVFRLFSPFSENTPSIELEHLLFTNHTTL